MARKLFEYAILYQGKKTKKHEDEGTEPDSRILKQPTFIMSRDEKEVLLTAAREIPKEYQEEAGPGGDRDPPFLRPAAAEAKPKAEQKKAIQSGAPNAPNAQIDAAMVKNLTKDQWGPVQNQGLAYQNMGALGNLNYTTSSATPAIYTSASQVASLTSQGK